MKKPSITLMTLLAMACGSASAADLLAMQEVSRASARHLPTLDAVGSDTRAAVIRVRTAVDVLNAEQQLALARSNLNQALYGTILNQLQLKATVGRLVETDLTDVNSLLKE